MDGILEDACPMKTVPLATVLLALCLCLSVRAQDAVGTLLAHTNSLRARQGLRAYGLDAALSSAAREHAYWMAHNNLVRHEQFDGSNVRARAVAAGFPSSWVAENIYLGRAANPSAAWNWWLGSPAHYAGLVSPNYDRVGIGSATVAARTAYVMVFGNSAGRLSQASAQASSGNPASDRQPAFVLGLDERGNIRHEVQTGHTIGDIALIYGYTWDDIPAMLALNGMRWEQIRWLQPGSEFLVPPKAGTYTPTAPPEAPLPATMAPALPSAQASQSAPQPLPSQPAPSASPMATRELRIDLPSAEPPDEREAAEQDALPQMLLLGLLIVAQVSLVGGLMLELLRRWR